jgi:hypothetical protein
VVILGRSLSGRHIAAHPTATEVRPQPFQKKVFPA